MRYIFWCAVITLAVSFSSISADEAKPAAPQAEFLQLKSRPLTEKERKEYYLRLIENFVGWTETSGKFSPELAAEPDGGAFLAAGKGVSWARGNGNLLIAYAVLLDAYPKREQFCRQKISRELLLDHFRKALRTLCLTNKNCSRTVTSKQTWGGPSWQAALEFQSAAWAAHLMEKELDKDTLALVREVVCKEADNLNKKIATMKPGDTGAEDCAWNAPLVAFAANKYADDPRAAKWDELAKKWTINAFSIPSDIKSDKLIDGRPIKDWIESENLFPDLTLENHGFWSVAYQFCFGLLGRAELAYRAFGKPVPQAFQHRNREMWETVQGVLCMRDGDLFHPQGLDWGWKDYKHMWNQAWLATFRGIDSAGAFESQALQMILKRQLGCGGTDLQTLDFGNQTELPSRWAFSYLMHRYAPLKKMVTIAEAEKEFQGAYVYPYTKVAIHHTAQKVVSVSWHHKSQAVLVLPETTNQIDPPFFFLNQRNSGSAQVKVRKDGKDIPMKTRLAKVNTDGGGMWINTQKTWGNAVTQFITVVSLPNEATAYLTIFRANNPAEVEVGPLFPQQVAQIPGFKSRIEQFRGDNWLNLADYIGFVSTAPLPTQIPVDCFKLTDPQKLKVDNGQWFGLGAVVIYVGQSHEKTAVLSTGVTLIQLSPGRLELTLPTSQGKMIIGTDYSIEGH